MAEKSNENNTHDVENQGRRDFIKVATTSLGAIGLAGAAWPFVNSWNADANVRALSKLEVNTANIELGQQVTFLLFGIPVFVRRRTPEQIEAARAVVLENLKDPQSDVDRFGEQGEWMVLVGSCTHLGCTPAWEPAKVEAYGGGYYCPCHGSYYDTSGRIRKGPAPTNLVIPTHTLDQERNILIVEAG